MTELPDFHIPHSEKIEWMIETHGWAIEAVGARLDTDPPRAGYAHTVGFPEAFGFPEVVVFGVTPSSARSMFDLVADVLRDGNEIPIDVELSGLFDGEMRCRFAPIARDLVVELLPTAIAWRRGDVADAVQLLWPDRNGFLPTEAGFDRRLLVAQPLVGTVG